MNCGVEYTHFPLFRDIAPYSRYTHSLGVAKIVYRFSRDPKQTLAGLYHDIASPCFAHVIDFLRGDYLKQEATEKGTSKIIANSKDIKDLLSFLELSTKEIDDYHLYQIADNDSPKLSADRLEYTLSNAMNLLCLNKREAQSLYDAVSLLPSGELGFQDEKKAYRFASLALTLGRVYCCDEDRYSMEILARLLKKAMTMRIISELDLLGTEDKVIAKLLASPLKKEWNDFCAMEALEKRLVGGEGWIRINAKKRYIDPLVGEKRLSSINEDFAKEKEIYLKEAYSVYLRKKA